MMASIIHVTVFLFLSLAIFRKTYLKAEKQQQQQNNNQAVL